MRVLVRIAVGRREARGNHYYLEAEITEVQCAAAVAAADADLLVSVRLTSGARREAAAGALFLPPVPAYGGGGGSERLVLGSTVEAIEADGDGERCWYAATVTRVHADDASYDVAWRDYPAGRSHIPAADVRSLPAHRRPLLASPRSGDATAATNTVASAVAVQRVQQVGPLGNLEQVYGPGARAVAGDGGGGGSNGWIAAVVQIVAHAPALRRSLLAVPPVCHMHALLQDALRALAGGANADVSALAAEYTVTYASVNAAALHDPTLALPLLLGHCTPRGAQQPFAACTLWSAQQPQFVPETTNVLVHNRNRHCAPLPLLLHNCPGRFVLRSALRIATEGPANLFAARVFVAEHGDADDAPYTIVEYSGRGRRVLRLRAQLAEDAASSAASATICIGIYERIVAATV